MTSSISSTIYKHSHLYNNMHYTLFYIKLYSSLKSFESYLHVEAKRLERLTKLFTRLQVSFPSETRKFCKKLE